MVTIGCDPIFTSVDSIFSIYKQIESLWRKAGTWPDYVEAMRTVLAPALSATFDTKVKYRPWVLLPGLCCQTAGGDPQWAEPVAAAWGLLHMAAHLLDSLENDDTPGVWWDHLKSGVAINVSTGLFASASLALRGLRCQNTVDDVVADITNDFYSSLLQACCGQHCILTQAELSLEKCWQVAEARSGVIFAVACRSGARLAIGDQKQLEQYGQFGHHFGMLVQISDDVNGIWTMQGAHSDLIASGKWTLPIAYAMAVSPPGVRVHLGECLQAASQNPVAEAEARRLIEKAGAPLYLLVEAERHRQEAQLALEGACPPSEARDKLMALLDNIFPLPLR